jgi:hypothetical protein
VTPPVRLPEYAAALQDVVLAAFNTDPPCRRRTNRPSSDAGRALAVFGAVVVATAAMLDAVLTLVGYTGFVAAGATELNLVESS